MKKSFRALLCIIFVFISLCIPAYADLQMPQVFSWEEDVAKDFNGNPITDCWAYDPGQKTEKFVKLDSKGKLIEKKADFEVEGQSKGWVELEAILPEKLKGYDVTVGITGPDSYQILLYEINDHKAMQEVLIGTYKVEVAMISGDFKGEFPAAFPDEIEVYENSTAAVLKIDFTKEEVEEPEITIQEEPEPIIEEEKEEKSISILQIIVISVFVIIILAGLYIFKKIRDNS
ncbi:MAG: hypothetical protein HFH60_03465 [Lachnospiraceae bacterium]|nr:hypothetical protein [Lachnospiraceae bacterium]